jgi:hypothetical protein
MDNNDKLKLSPNLTSYVPVRRGNWIFKVSAYRNKQIMIIVQHFYDADRFETRFFTDELDAVKYIDFLTLQE